MSVGARVAPRARRGAPLALILILAAGAPAAEELLVNGGFDRGVEAWTIDSGRLEPAQRQDPPSPAARLVPVERKVQVRQSVSGVAGRVLLIRASLLMTEGGETTQLFTLWQSRDWSRTEYVNQWLPRPASDWQEVQLVVPAPDWADRVSVGLLHKSEHPVLIDDWSLRLR